MLPPLRLHGRLPRRIDNSGAPYPAVDMNRTTRINRVARAGCDGRGYLDRALAIVGAGMPVAASAIGEHDVGIASGTVEARCLAIRWSCRPHPCCRNLRVSRRHRREARETCRPVDIAGMRHLCSGPRAVPVPDCPGSSTPRLCRSRADATQFMLDIRAMAESGDAFASEPPDVRTVAMSGESRRRASDGRFRAAMTREDHRFEEASGRLAALADARDHAA